MNRARAADPGLVYAAGGRVTCPQCPLRWSTEQALAVHLMDAHGLAAPAAVDRARETLRDAAKVARRAVKVRRLRSETGADLDAAAAPVVSGLELSPRLVAELARRDEDGRPLKRSRA